MESRCVWREQRHVDCCPARIGDTLLERRHRRARRSSKNYRSSKESSPEGLTRATPAARSSCKMKQASSKAPTTRLKYLFLAKIILVIAVVISGGALQGSWPLVSGQQTQLQESRTSNRLPDLMSSTSDEPIVAVIGQDAFISCVAKNLQNYTVIWRYTNEANAPGLSENRGQTNEQQAGQLAALNPTDELGTILTAGRQRVTSDSRISVIQSHDTWLLKINNARLSDTGTYICQTNSEPRVRALRILSVIKPTPSQTDATADSKLEQLSSINFDFTDCCRAEYVVPRCQRLCSFQQLASRYQSINIVHECFSALPSITRCMVAGRNVTDCCQRRHIPARCNPMCGHLGDTSSMSVQDQSFCADYSASIMSCVAEGINTLPGQPELVIVEAVSSTTLKVSWQKVTDESELRKIDGWVINLAKLSSFEDTISSPAKRGSISAAGGSLSSSGPQQLSAPASVSSSTTSDAAPAAGLPQPPGHSGPLDGLKLVDTTNNASLTTLLTSMLAQQQQTDTISLRVGKQQAEFSIDNLKPYTVYQIQMFAYNSNGRSQLTDPIRALTLAPENELTSSASNEPDAYVEPQLPDTRKCCLDRGVTLKRCLDTLCDPVEADRATIADLMICAPWSNVTFGCLSSRVNHTDCCKSRGVTPFCLSMCSGEIKRVDYRHFRCLTHMSTYTNCILESHNVLPSPPQNFTVGPITHTWAVLNWRPPKKHAKSLQGYRIFWRRVDPVGANSSLVRMDQGAGSGPMGDSGSLLNDEYFYASAEAATNPYLLDALQPATVYETFVVAVNKYGQSESSVRFIFQTLNEPEGGRGTPAGGALESRLPLTPGQDSEQAKFYNETACCLNSGVHSSCQQLCDYDLKVSDVSSLITGCNSQMPAILRCMAGNRNSVPCCRNRGVSDQCLNVCAGLTEHSPLVVATRCASDFGKIIRCMDEGSKQIPGAPTDLHTLDIKPDRLTIKWAPASEDALRGDIEYHVRYQQLRQPVDQAAAQSANDPSALIAVVPLHPLEHNLILTTNKTEATVDKLKAGSRYSIYVTAENPYGISLPSLVLVVQTPGEDEQVGEGYKRRATLGAPHSLEILRSDTESIVLKWIAPLFISNEAQIKYRVFYKFLGSQNATAAESTTTASSNGDGGVQQLASNWTVMETSETSALLRNLRYSSQYAITVQAFSKQMLGHMSEILIAATAKPVPPTLNHPLIINSPIEGNNITIMCVALGQPTPQISMFINGLLVQKRTQPYVIYHLVNLVRGHLTITCFASNGHGSEYASVQSRTEVSVRFPSKASAKLKALRAAPMSTVRLTCDVAGNPQPTVVWTFAARPDSQGAPSEARVVQANERVTTLLVSQFESPFTWSHTLTIRNVSSADAGKYQCRSRNTLAESLDEIELELGADTSESSSAPAGKFDELRQLEQSSDLMQCCRSQNVSAKCLPVCSVDGLDVEGAFRITECQPHLDKLMFCAADGSDHRNCCRTRQVPSSCLRWCSGAKFNIPALCFLSSALDINQCFQEGRALLPGPPRRVRVMLASDSEHGEREVESPEVATMTTSNSMGTVGMFAPLVSPATGGSEATNSSSSSVINSMAMMIGEGQTSPNAAEVSTPGPSGEVAAGNQLQQQQNSEPLIIEWDPPAKNPNLVQYYRIFWRPIGSRELSRTVTNLTWIKLNDLNMSKQYEFVVKAANQHGSSVYSDPLLVKPSEILSGGDLSSVGMIWFMPSSSVGHLVSRVFWSMCFATMFMFASLAFVVLLERRGYLKRFASSKSNSSRVSFANPAYLKDAEGDQENDNVTWETGAHSLDVLGLPPVSSDDQQSAGNNPTSFNGAGGAVK